LLHEDTEISKAELLYAIRHEYVRKPLDFIVRRVNLGLTDQHLSSTLLHSVCKVMQEELTLSDEQTAYLMRESLQILEEAV